MGYSDKISISTGDQISLQIITRLHTIILVTCLIIAICNVYDSQINISERVCIMGDVLSEEPQTSRFPCANGLA